MVPGEVVPFTDFYNLWTCNGNVVFVAASSVGPGIYTNHGGSLRKVADNTDLAPGGLGATFSFSSGSYVSMEGDQILFSTNKSSDSGLYLEHLGSLSLIADQSTLAPSGLGTFSDLSASHPPLL
jgi:hypothetical protein